MLPFNIILAQTSDFVSRDFDNWWKFKYHMENLDCPDRF